MKKSNTQPLKEVIQEYLEALKMNSKLKEVGVVNSWERVVGKTIARATKDIYIRDRVLYVHVNSSVVRNELDMIKEPLKDRLNEDAKADVIDAIVLK